MAWVKRDPSWLTEGDVCRSFGWSIAEFRSARAFGFPRCEYLVAGTKKKRTMAPVWPRPAVDRWADEIRALRIRERS